MDFAGLTQDVILRHAFALAMVLSRTGATFALLPGLGESTIPAVVKAGIIMALTIVLLPVIEPLLPPPPDNPAVLGLMIGGELINGLWFGWLARMMTVSLALAGQFISDFAGLTNVLIPSPDLGPQTAAIAQLYNVAVPALVLSSGLYTRLLTALVGFYRLAPPGTIDWLPDTTSSVVTVVARGFNLSVQLAAPFILASVAWYTATGLVARLVPRLQIFFVALPGQIGLAMLLLVVATPAILSAWMDAVRVWLGTLPSAG